VYDIPLRSEIVPADCDRSPPKTRRDAISAGSRV